MRAAFIRRQFENHSKTIITFWFRPEATLDHIAGQYIELSLPHNSSDTRGIKRWFTISSSPTEAPLISITTRLLENNCSSFKRTLQALRPGDSVQLNEPMGDFVLPKDDRIPLIFVAGGIGITPFHSIIQYLYKIKQQRNIHLIYGVGTEQDILFQDLFERYGMNRSIIIIKPTGAWDGLTGVLSGARIVDLAKSQGDSLIYVSGPESLVDSLFSQLTELGIPKTSLVGDYFPGYSKI